MEPDLSLMYSELDLPRDCTLEEFKCAYRRRIAELHPDRKGEQPESPEAQAALLALISTYVAVNRFHRRHGRMPGASPRASAASRTAGAGGDSRTPQMTSRTTLPVPVPSNDATDRSTRPTWKFVILFLALLVLLASWDWLTLASQ